MEPESSSDEESEEGHDRRDRSYDPLAWKSDSDDSFKFPKKRKKKVETGFAGKRFKFYDDRSDDEMSDDLEEANYDEIEEEEFISGAIGEKEDEEERLR